MRLFEDCTRLVSIIGLFSTNESYKEVSTNDLKYLLLPFFLGQLSQKLCGGSRQNIIEISEVYFKYANFKFTHFTQIAYDCVYFWFSFLFQ